MEIWWNGIVDDEAVDDFRFCRERVFLGEDSRVKDNEKFCEAAGNEGGDERLEFSFSLSSTCQQDIVK